MLRKRRSNLPLVPCIADLFDHKLVSDTVVTAIITVTFIATAVEVHDFVVALHAEPQELSVAEKYLR